MQHSLSIGAALAAAVVLVVAAAGCAQPAGPDLATVGTEFEASSEFLAGAAERSSAEAYRIETDMSMHLAFGGDELDIVAAVTTGEVDGRRSSMTMEMGALFESMADAMPPSGAPPGALLGGDLTMEFVTDGDTMYLRAPVYAAMVDAMLADT
jgi:hypothetical protein